MPVCQISTISKGIEHFCQPANQNIGKAVPYKFAMNATQGISNTFGSEYSIAGIPDKKFSGYQYLAWYYASWALAIPDMKDQLGLPYEKEWDMANSLY